MAWPKNTPGLGSAAERIAERVRLMTNDRLRIKLFGAGELVGAYEVFDAVSSGTAEVGHSAAYYWRGKHPAFAAFATVPFGMNAIETNSWLHFGGGLELWREGYAQFNLVPFAAGNSGTQMGGWFNRELNSLADLQGLKMRIPGFGGDVIERAGGVAVNIPGNEIFTSLQTGVIDATEWVGPYNDLAFGLHTAAKYYYYPGWHEPNAVLELMVNKEAFESLPMDMQLIIESAARAENQNLQDEYTARNNAALATLIEEHGVELRRLPDDVLAEFAIHAKQVIDELASVDEYSKRVVDSYRAFQQTVASYHEISEEAYFNIRRTAAETAN